MLLKEFISPVYWNLIPEVLDLEVPEEKFASCSDCHYCQNPNEPKSLTKCCEYYPTIPNYMIGAILSDETGRFEEGKQRIRKIIRKKAGVIPNGIIQPLAYVLDYKKIRKSGVYLKNKEEAITLRCPYYEKGNCSIYAYRTEICSTFFCHSVSGKVGQAFWNNFLTLLRSIENKLAIYAMKEMSYDFKNVETVFPDVRKLKLDSDKGIVNNSKYNRLWQKWKGKEEQFYINAFMIIQQINKEYVLGFLSLEDKIKMEKCKSLAKDMNEAVIPNILKFNADMELVKDDMGRFKIKKNNLNVGLSDLDLLNMRLFDGKRSTYEVIRKATLLRSNFSNKIPRLMKIGILDEPLLAD